MVFKILWLFNLILILFFSINFSSIFSLLMMLVIFIISSSIIISVGEKNIWMSSIFFIFLIGGLMISFFFMVSMVPNNQILEMKIKYFFIFLLAMSIDKSEYSSSSNLKTDSFHLSLTDKFSAYLYFVIFILLFIFFILYFVDSKVKDLKGSIKEMS